MPLIIRKGEAVNLLTVALSTVLTLGLSAATSYTVQAQDSESKPVDQVKVMKVTGVVQKVDDDKHRMTIKLDNGKKQTLKVDKSVKGLDQFKPNDRVQLSYTQEIIAMTDSSDEGAGRMAKYGAVDIEPEGDKPALVKVDTSEISGKLVSIDPQKRRLTFEDPDGKKRTLKLSQKIKDLDKFKPGDTINMAITDETVIEVVNG
jgi:Cu/Ag efflux protein CusF